MLCCVCIYNKLLFLHIDNKTGKKKTKKERVNGSYTLEYIMVGLVDFCLTREEWIWDWSFLYYRMNSHQYLGDENQEMNQNEHYLKG